MNLTDLKVKELIDNKQTFVVDVWGTWCSPCKMVGPIIDKLSEKYKDKLIIGKIDVDENPETTSKFNIRGIPAVLFFKNGELVDTQVGAAPENAYITKIESLLNG
jgi:thioredoxin 1